MKAIACAITALAMCVTTNPGYAAAQCNIAGQWTDAYGMVTIFRNETAGRATGGRLCGPYKVKTILLTKTTWDITGTPKNARCFPFRMGLTFATGVCKAASGYFYLDGEGGYGDTFTKTASAIRDAPSRAATIATGLR